jgi:hypothetical protein
MMRSHDSSETSAVFTVSPTSPALLIRMSTVPKRSSALWTIACVDAATETSASTAIASPPASETMDTVSSAPGRLMSAATTLTPSPASSFANSRPRPEPAPVMIATLPSSPCMGTPSFCRDP